MKQLEVRSVSGQTSGRIMFLRKVRDMFTCTFRIMQDIV